MGLCGHRGEGGSIAYRRPTSSRTLFLVFAGVVASFVLATTISEYSDLQIGTAADEIVLNASPSVDHVSHIRGSIRQLEVVLDDYVDGVAAAQLVDQPMPSSLTELRGSIASIQKDIHDEWRVYRALPTFAGERELWGPVARELAALDESIGPLLAPIAGAGDGERWQTILTRDIRPIIDRLDTGLLHIRELNTRGGERVGARIKSLSRLSIGLAVGLDLFSIGLTFVLASLLLSTIRHFERIQSDRSEELESFAGRVAHDILSPLGALHMQVDVIARPHAPKQTVDRYRAQITRSLGNVQQLVDALLEFARAGARPTLGARSEVAPVLAGLVDELRLQASAERVELRVDAQAPLAVACSPGVFMSCVGNLVRNAVKYMGEATTRIVTIRIRERAGARVRVEVEDTGPGLPAGFVDHAFSPYVRGDNAAGRAGIGLGLATVRRLVEAHGGRVGVRSSPGHGCTFWFELEKSAA